VSAVEEEEQQREREWEWEGDGGWYGGREFVCWYGRGREGRWDLEDGV
jgi:hypothetical protein